MEYKLGDIVAMRSNAKILWIDDNPEREKRANILEEETGIKVEFISVKGMDLAVELPKIRKKYKPDLVIIDHVLNDTQSEGWARYGSTLVGFFRETWEGCPIFGITAAMNLEQIDIERYTYDELIDYTEFSQYIRYIPNVIEGFKKSSKVKSIENWILLLKAPKQEVERIKGCIPHNVKTAFGKKGFSNMIYRWFRTKFYKMPGFLYDRNWVATFAGIKKDAIKKYLKHFRKAQYDGIFNDIEHTRWWKTSLYKIIYEKCKDKNAPLRSTQDVANEVLAVKTKNRSKCNVCYEKWPETFAYTENTASATMEQMHLRCTLAHPLYRYEPMFEEMRIMARGKVG